MRAIYTLYALVGLLLIVSFAGYVVQRIDVSRRTRKILDAVLLILTCVAILGIVFAKWWLVFYRP